MFIEEKENILAEVAVKNKCTDTGNRVTHFVNKTLVGTKYSGKESNCVSKGWFITVLLFFIYEISTCIMCKK